MRTPEARRIIPKAAVVAALGFIMAKGYNSLESSDPGIPTKELQAHAAKIAEIDTGCYAFGQKPLQVRTREIDGAKQSVISIPIRDTSTHKKGQNSWVDAASGQGANLLQSGFIAEYPILGGKKLEQPAIGVISTETGTTPQSTKYNLELGVDSTIPGKRVANIFYAADVAINNGSTNPTLDTIRGSRLCGSIGYNVASDGTLSNVHVLNPTDKVGQMSIAHNLADTPPLSD